MFEQRDIQQLMEAGRKKVETRERDVLVSTVVKTDAIDPVSFFNAGPVGQRLYWTDASRGVTFVGLGQALVLEAQGNDDRFKRINDKWQEIVGNSVTDNTNAPGFSGPTLFGGFSFDPLKPKTPLWREFADTLFVVPEFMLTITDQQAWLTFNYNVRPESDDKIVSESAHAIIKEIKEKLAQPLRKTEAAIEGIQEIAPNLWMDSVESAASSIRDGEIEKVVLARELRLTASERIDVTSVLNRLLREQADSYIFAFEQGTDCFIGATPERLIKREGDRYISTCLAGSIARGTTAEEDEALGSQLLNDPKNRHEHQLVVDMIRGAMNAVCEEVVVPDKPELYKTKDIQHLFTPVEGVARKMHSILTAVKLLHPTPALGGYPQQQAVEVIRMMELLDRGWYAAPIGWLNNRGDGEFAVAIRSALIQGKEASLFAGCGIVGHSDPVSEYEETQLKFRPMLSALNAMEISVGRG